MLSPNRALMKGVPTLVGEAMTATGTGEVRPFSILNPPGAEGVVTCQASGTFTVLNGNLEASLDGGTTWSVLVAFDFVASAIFIFNAAAGALYRFNVANITQSIVPSITAVLS